jgi:LmbE family N-acetylglucosaminyl deacetylase
MKVKNIHTKIAQNILIVSAHMDDEITGLGGFILKHSEEKNIYIISICKGRKGQENDRITSFSNIMDTLNVTYSFLEYNDLTLSLSDIPDIATKIDEIIKLFFIDTVFIPCESDIHQEHMIVSKAGKIAARPFTHVKNLYEYHIPGSNNFSLDTSYNTYFDVTTFKDEKLDLIKKYNTEKINLDLIIHDMLYSGHMIDSKHTIYAEKAKLIYSKA